MAKTRPKLEGTIRVGAKRQVTIPHRISSALRLKKGDHMLMRLVGGRVEMIPVSLVPKDQLWFWTPEWQKKEREADEDIAQGRVKEFSTVEELLKDLKSQNFYRITFQWVGEKLILRRIGTHDILKAESR